MKNVDPKNYKEEDDHNHQDKSSNKGAEDKQTSKPKKAHLTCEFVIVAIICYII